MPEFTVSITETPVQVIVQETPVQVVAGSNSVGIVSVGIQGPTGPQGPPGAGTLTTSYPAWGTLSGGSCVAVNSSGYLLPSSPTGLMPCDGILASGVTSGQLGLVQYGGPYHSTLYSFSVGKTAFVGVNGYPSLTQPTASGQTIQSLGKTTDASGLLVSPGNSLLLLGQ